MKSTDNLEIIFETLGFDLPGNIKSDIELNLANNNYVNKHFAFIIDLKTNKVICYDNNIYFKSDSFPFSIHAEIQSIIKYYKSRSMSKSKKALVVIKLSRTGLVGNSKFCLNCSRFIRNNFDNLNLKKVYYSTMKTTQLVELSKADLVDENFRMSKGFMGRCLGKDNLFIKNK